MNTPTGADAMKEAEELIARFESASIQYGKPESGMLQGTAVRGTRESLLAFIRKLVEAQPAAVAGEAATLRMLTEEEAFAVQKQCAYSKFMLEWYFVETLQRKFCEVNGLRLAAPVAPLVGEPTFARGSWQHALDDQLVGFGKTSEEFANPHEAVAWLVKQVGECAVSLSAPPAAPAGVPTALHAAIMGLPCARPKGWGSVEGSCYHMGHLDARQAAAELASAYLPACTSSEASGSAIPARPTLPGDDALHVLRELVEAHDAHAAYRSADGIAAYRNNRDRYIAAQQRAHALLARGDQKAAPLHPSSVQVDNVDEPK